MAAVPSVVAVAVVGYALMALSVYLLWTRRGYQAVRMRTPTLLIANNLVCFLWFTYQVANRSTTSTVADCLGNLVIVTAGILSNAVLYFLRYLLVYFHYRTLMERTTKHHRAKEAAASAKLPLDAAAAAAAPQPPAQSPAQSPEQPPSPPQRQHLLEERPSEDPDADLSAADDESSFGSESDLGDSGWFLSKQHLIHGRYLAPGIVLVTLVLIGISLTPLKDADIQALRATSSGSLASCHYDPTDYINLAFVALVAVCLVMISNILLRPLVENVGFKWELRLISFVGVVTAFTSTFVEDLYTILVFNIAAVLINSLVPALYAKPLSLPPWAARLLPGSRISGSVQPVATDDGDGLQTPDPAGDEARITPMATSADSLLPSPMSPLNQPGLHSPATASYSYSSVPAGAATVNAAMPGGSSESLLRRIEEQRPPAPSVPDSKPRSRLSLSISIPGSSSRATERAADPQEAHPVPEASGVMASVAQLPKAATASMRNFAGTLRGNTARVTLPPVTLERVLGDPAHYAAFESFLTLEFSVENLYFYMDVLAYRADYTKFLAAWRNPRAANATGLFNVTGAISVVMSGRALEKEMLKLHRQALAIFSKYLADDAPFRVNCYSDRILQRLKLIFESDYAINYLARRPPRAGLRALFRSSSAAGGKVAKLEAGLVPGDEAAWKDKPSKQQPRRRGANLTVGQILAQAAFVPVPPAVSDQQARPLLSTSPQTAPDTPGQIRDSGAESPSSRTIAIEMGGMPSRSAAESQLQRKLETASTAIPGEVFDEAFESIKHMMRQDSFARFLRSTKGKEVVRAIRNSRVLDASAVAVGRPGMVADAA